MKTAPALFAAMLVLAMPSTGETRSALKAPEFLTFSGKCLRVAMGKQDMTPACTGMLGGSEHADGRNGIYFLMANNHIVTFSGKATDKRGGFPIDRVVFNTGEKAVPPQAVRATGRCSYTDPNKGPVTIRCVGALAEGTSFVASFRTDGTAPQ